MSSSKRKSVDSDCNEAHRKKLRESQSLENGETVVEQDVIGSCVDGTLEYSPDSSDGFDLQEETLLDETDEDCKEGETDSETIAKLQRSETEEYTPDVEHGEDKETQDVPTTSLEKILSVQKDAELITGIIPGIDLQKVYEHILKHRKMENRVDYVTNEILEKNENDNAAEGSSISDIASDEGIFKEVAEVLVVRPTADPNKVFDLLDQLKDNEKRVEKVLAQLTPADDLPSRSSSGSSQLSKTSASQRSTDISSQMDAFSDPAFKTNPLYRDLKTLRKVLPDKDPNEIYAFLEAHYDKPNRVQVVIDELTKSDSQESLPLQTVDSLEDTVRGKAPLTATDKFQADLKELQDIFRDCDPNYLYEKLDNLSDDKERVQKIAAELFEHKNYPKLKDVQEKEKKEQLKHKIAKMEFNMSSFLKKFPAPIEYFSDISRTLNQNYKDHVLIYMKNTFPFLKDGYIKKVLKGQNYHLTPTIKQVDEELRFMMGRPSKKKRATPRTEQLDYPEDPDEPFFQELMFCQHKQQIIDHIKEQTHLRNIKIEAAREHGELLECGCCYDDECLFEEMAACTDGHIFCKECIRRSSEAAIGEGKTKFLCLTGTCESEFPLAVLQELLPATTFSLALCKMQEEELRLADIPDLVTCPFCSFATIMPDKDDKVFKCLNLECLRESCRLCQEPNHVPLRCNEVEKQGATNLRTFIEMKVSEAMLRICPKCKKRFFKQTGCNKMTCTCGTTMCYVCRTPDIDYGHFDNGCPIDSDVQQLHDQEMMQAAKKAKEEYFKEHPDQDPELDTDELLSKLKRVWEQDMDDYDEDDDYD